MRILIRLALATLSASLLMAQYSDDESNEEEEQAPESAPAAKPEGGAKPASPPAKSGTTPPKQPTEMSLDYQMKAWSVVNASAARINECLDKHIQFQPAAVGTVELSLEIAGDGRMLKVDTKSALPASEKLQQCLKFLAQSWKFPSAPGIEKFSTTLQIRVQKGQKFALTKPGDKPAANKPADDKKGDSGFLGFAPSWGNGYYQ